MTSYAIYDVESGLVVRKGRGAMRSALIGLQHSESIYWGEVNAATQRIVNGELQDREPDTKPVTVQQVKDWAFRLLAPSDWRSRRADDRGEPMEQEWIDYREGVRQASDALEAMDPIPQDYRDAKYWPDQL